MSGEKINGLIDSADRSFKEEKFDQALRSYRDILETHPGLPSETKISLISKIIICLHRTGKYSKVPQELDRFERLFDPSSISYAKLQTLKANAYRNLEDFDRTIEIGERAFKILRPTGEMETFAKVQRILGTAYLSRGNWERAKGFLEGALFTYRRIDDKNGILYSINRLSQLCFISAEWNQAIKYLKHGLKAGEKWGKKEWIASLSLNLGIMYWKIGNWTLATEYLHKGIEAAKAIGHTLGTVRGRLSLAFLARLQRRWRDATKLLEECRRVCEEGEYKRELCLCYEGLGEVAFDRGDYTKAKKYYDKALNIVNDIAPEGDLAVELHRRLGELHLAIEEFQQAQNHCGLAFKAVKGLHDRFEEACTYRIYALIYRRLNEPEKARESFIQALQLLETVGEKYEKARTHLEFSRFLRETRNPDEALRHLIKAEELFQSLPSLYWVGMVELERAKIEVDREDFNSAISFFDKAQRFFTELKERETLTRVLQLRREVERKMVTIALQGIRRYSIPKGGLQELTEHLAKKLRAERAFLALSDERDFEIKGLHNMREEEAREVVISLNGFGLKTPIISTNIQLDRKFHWLQKNGILSFMALPLGVAGTKGVLYVDRKSSFTSKELIFSVRYTQRLALRVSELHQMELKEETFRLKKKLYPEIVTRDKRMLEILDIVDKIKDDSARVLIEGETGTGKELIAKAIHYKGRRGSKPFIPVDCGVLTETLAESTLFGHKKGAFTDAKEDRIGLFEQANGGTLFLDEVSNLNLGIQAKLLRVFEEGKIRRIGETKERKVDVRIIAASNKDLKEEVSKGKFRKDLYYRLKGIRIQLPPLRERRGDIPLLVNHFIERFSKQKKKEVKGLREEAMRALTEYVWPGNVRELEREIERAIILMEDEIISVELFSENLKSSTKLPLPEQLSSFERQRILTALKEAKWVKRRAARVLGIPEGTLRAKIKKYNLSHPLISA